MNKYIQYNWLIIAITALLIAAWIAVFEHFVSDKGYVYVILSILSGWLWYRGRKRS